MVLFLDDYNIVSNILNTMLCHELKKGLNLLNKAKVNIAGPHL